MLLSLVLVLVLVISDSACNEETIFLVEGHVSVPNASHADWIPFTKIHITGGNFQGFVKDDGSFTTSLPPGSYIFDIRNPTFQFTVQRINVSSEGKITAQTINHIYPDNVTEMVYPLLFKSVGRIQYFDIKYEFRVIDIVMSKMVLMMFLPMIIMLVALKFVDLDDPEVKEDLNSLNLKERLPDMAELIVRFTGRKNPESEKGRAVLQMSQEEVQTIDRQSTKALRGKDAEDGSETE